MKTYVTDYNALALATFKFICSGEETTELKAWRQASLRNRRQPALAAVRDVSKETPRKQGWKGRLECEYQGLTAMLRWLGFSFTQQWLKSLEQKQQLWDDAKNTSWKSEDLGANCASVTVRLQGSPSEVLCLWSGFPEAEPQTGCAHDFWGEAGSWVKRKLPSQTVSQVKTLA